MASKKQPLISVKWYLFTDFLAIIIASFCGYFYIESSEIHSFFYSPFGWWKIGFFVMGFLGSFWLIGNYQLGLYHKSRLNELTDTLWVTLIYLLLWVLIIRLGTSTYGMGYFTLLYCKFCTLFFIVIGFFRFALLIYIKNQLYNSSVYFATLIIGNNADAVKAYQSVYKNYHYTGWKIIGFVSADNESKNGLHKHIPYLGSMQQLNAIIKKESIEQIIIALDKSQRDQIDAIVRQYSNSLLSIKMIPSTLDILAGAVKTNNVFGATLIDIKIVRLSHFQQNIKRIIDILTATVGLVLLSPFLLLAAFITALCNKGTIIYRQERIGYRNKPFTIYKFISMYPNAEANGPLLSSENDARVTPLGKFFRKWRIDELPQLWNIIKGDMSLVGPRPERPFYINQIVQKAPHYQYLLSVKPGLSSWGMVQFGYASSVEEMIERMQYDLMYVENASILLDLKIMLHTLRIILMGQGK